MEDHLHLGHPCSTTCGTPIPPMQPPAPPAQPTVPTAQSGPMPQLNWSHFKPDFVGKPHEDVAEHLLRTNDWMDNHAFPEGVKVQKFCFTSVREARLWYESLRPIMLDWNGLQTQFRQQ